MVNRPMDTQGIQTMNIKSPKFYGTSWRRKSGRRVVEVRFTDTMFEKLRLEAAQRGWTIPAMIRHLCEASIEGIE